MSEFAQEGWANLMGGFCGTTPAHIKALAAKIYDLTPRKLNPQLKLRFGESAVSNSGPVMVSEAFRFIPDCSRSTSIRSSDF